MKLTKRAIDALPASDKRLVAWDDELSGFGVRISPGGERVYVLKYRHDGEQRWFTIGKHGAPWTPEQARKQALKLLGAIALGGDPARKRKQDRTAMTVAELCDQYLSEGVTHKKPLTLKADRGRIEHHIKPLLGMRRVVSLTRADVEKLLTDVAGGKTAVKVPAQRARGTVPRGGQGVAAQCVVLLGTLLSFAVNRGIRTDNPAHGVKKPAVRKIERYLTKEEIPRLASALKKESARAPYECAAIALLLFTGCRRGEIMSLRWGHVDLDRELLLLPDSKTGAKPVYLNAPAIHLLKQIPLIPGNPHVIAGKREGAHSTGINKVWERVRKSAGLEDVRLHDLRHSFASVGAAASIGLQAIGKLLGHSSTAVTERYAHLQPDPVRHAAGVIGERIAAFMELAS